MKNDIKIISNPKCIPELFQSNDKIYHYTETGTALLNILPERRLRLSPRQKSNDPIEIAGVPNLDFYNNYHYKNNINENEIKIIVKQRNELIEQSKQLCFCKNNTTIKTKDDYGLAKPRMWDQYGDNYKGVCLVFSLKALEKNMDESFVKNDVRYLDYSRLYQETFDFDYKDLTNMGFEKYRNSYLENFKEHFFFRKQKDYEGENEYRVCSFSKKCFDYLEIKDSLKAIILSEQGLNKHLINAFENALSKYQNMEIFILAFKNDDILLYQYEAYKRKQKYFVKN